LEVGEMSESIFVPHLHVGPSHYYTFDGVEIGHLGAMNTEKRSRVEQNISRLSS